MLKKGGMGKVGCTQFYADNWTLISRESYVTSY